ncbi:nuclear protein localization protein 4 [Irineochytrium annulatum]|nr:nuclear protein localization protein 4 [Irineochytrium annulatum]
MERLNIDRTDANYIVAEVAKALKVAESSFALYMDQAHSKPLNTSNSASLKHGDIVFAKSAPVAENREVQQHAGSVLDVRQDPLDDMLEREKGLIMRKRDPTFCRHGYSGMCDYCMPLEPYDSTYLETNKIKHLSFHSYLRKIMNSAKTAPVSSPAFIPPLDEPELKVLNPCPSKMHEPYPAGICTKCQPSAITLQSQAFRMVDHVEFDSGEIMETFIKYWRQTGHQRFGYMYGRYEPYPEVPLGVKAVVSVIYEPPQDTAADMIQLHLPSNEEGNVKATTDALALQLVGMIYTDLFDDGTGKGTVLCKRHADSYFVSSAECILSAQLQQLHPTVTKYSRSHVFGSRFVSCVVSGNLEGQIDVTCFQVSNIGMAMARDNIIEASVEPSLMRVRPSSNEQYIPEVFYRYKNKYGLMVQESAKPTFPVEYLLVTLSHGFPQTPKPAFTSTSFPVENRVGEGGGLPAFKQRLDSGKLVDVLSDFHLILFLRMSQILDEADFAVLASVARDRREEDARKLEESGGWQTLVMIAGDSHKMDFEQGAGINLVYFS